MEGKWRNSFEQMKKKSWKKEKMFEMERMIKENQFRKSKNGMKECRKCSEEDEKGLKRE